LNKNSKIESIFGPMYAGKSSELMKRILWFSHQKLPILVIKPNIDDRYSTNEIVTHTGHKYPCEYLKDLTQYVKNNNTIINYHTIFIDEIQFFDINDVKEFVKIIKLFKINLIISGLDQDSSGEPFESSAYILAISDNVTKLQSYCNICGQAATKTYKLHNSGNRVDVASYGVYEARCLDHWEPRK
jgi:thymidine kinase